MSVDTTSSNESIRAARELFNRAIANKDVDTIGGLLAPTYHIVTGRSAQNHGVDEEVKRWEAVFRSDETAVYRRTPREITINEEWGLAEELGNWRGSYTVENVLVQASGVYSAKWQRTVEREWVLQVEVFTTLSCEVHAKSPIPYIKSD